MRENEEEEEEEEEGEKSRSRLNTHIQRLEKGEKK